MLNEIITIGAYSLQAGKEFMAMLSPSPDRGKPEGYVYKDKDGVIRYVPKEYVDELKNRSLPDGRNEMQTS